jgi:hypothetical protein
MTPEVIVSVTASHEGDGFQRVRVIIYNVKLSYSDDRGSKFSSDHTSISLDFCGIDSWMSIGAFTRREEGEPEVEIPF